MDLSTYIQNKINILAKSFADEFVMAQMFQDYDRSSKISKRLLKAREQKILMLQKYNSHDKEEIEYAKKLIDSMSLFDPLQEWMG